MALQNWGNIFFGLGRWGGGEGGWVPYNKDYSILGFILGTPILGNYQFLKRGSLRESMRGLFRPQLALKNKPFNDQNSRFRIQTLSMRFGRPVIFKCFLSGLKRGHRFLFGVSGYRSLTYFTSF